MTNLNPLTNAMTTVGATNMNTNMDYLDLFSNLITDDFSEETEQALSETREQLKEKFGKEKVQWAERCTTLIAGYRMIQSVGGKDTWLGELLFNSLVESTQWWVGRIKGTNERYGRRFFNALIEIVGEDHSSIAVFKEAIAFTRNYRVNKLEDGSKQLQFIVKNKQNEVIQDEILKTFAASPVELTIFRSSVQVKVGYNTTIKPIKGRSFVFNRHMTANFGLDVINQNLESVLKRVRIHNEYTRYDHEMYGNKIVSYAHDFYQFNKEDSLVLLLILKANNLDIKEVFKHYRTNDKKCLVLTRKENTSAVKSLERMVAPAFTFAERYAKSGVTSLNDAKQGYVVPMQSISRLVEFKEDASQQVQAITRESVNKTINRFDKLNNAEALWTHSVRMFVVKNAVKHIKLNEALVGGNALFSDDFLEINGACRVVTDMDQGGVKSSTAPLKMLDKKLAQETNLMIVSAAGYKGGLLAAVGQVTNKLDIISNIKSLLSTEKNSALILKHIVDTVDKELTTLEINGETVEGIMVTVDLKITNAYTVDSLMSAKEVGDKSLSSEQDRVRQVIEDLMNEIDTEQKASKGLRAYVAEQKAASSDLFSVGEWMASGLKKGTLVRKPLVTKVIIQELQSIAHWFGKHTAKMYLQALLNNQVEHGFKKEKIYALQLIGALEKIQTKMVDVKDILDILASSEYELTTESVSYPKEIMQEILELFTLDNDFGWVNLVYPSGDQVSVPVGNILVSDINEQMEDNKKSVIAKGLIKDVLENIKSLRKDNGDIYTDSKNHLILKALVQRPLLGKNFGYQFTKGYYGVALPLIGNYAITTAAITNRNRMVKSDDTWVQMTLSKAPQYFKGMTATYNILDLDLGHMLNMVLECAIFVNEAVALMHQNDFDGDLYRITLGSDLPYVTRLFNEFNGNFFKNFYDGEKASNFLKIKEAQMCTIQEYHEAVHTAILAKGHIGSYTANSYFYEAMLANLVNTTVTTYNGKTIEVTEDIAYQITAIMKMLIQIEAMDNVKQEGSSTYITEQLLHYVLRNKKGFNGVSDEVAITKHLDTLVANLLKLVDAYDMDLTAAQVIEIVDIIYYTAKTFDTKETTALNMFNARNINEKAIANVMAHIEGEDLNTVYDFEDCFASIEQGIDQHSMYYETIMATLDASLVDGLNIRC